MAFLSKVGNILRQTTSKQISNELSGSRPSIYQAVRYMSSSKLFVGGIAYTTDDTSLREAFSKYGEVVEARIILDRETGKSRGFGFVTYNSSEEASSAIQAFDGQDLHGRRVKVNYANDRARGSFGGGGGFGGGGYGGGGYGAGGGGGGYGAGGGSGSGSYGAGAGGGGYNSVYGGNYGAGNTSGGGDYAGGNVGPASGNTFGGNTFESSNLGSDNFGTTCGSDNFGATSGGDNFGSSNFSGGDGQFFDKDEPLEGRDDDDSDLAKRA